MTQDQREYLDKLTATQEKVSFDWLNYWQEWSHMGTWQFWVIAAMIVVPLIVIFFLIDRRRVFLLGFFGFNVHVWFTYIDFLGARFGLWGYPYQAIPYLSVSFGLDAALIPVIYMLVYQWVLHKGKNPYISLGVLSLFLSFAFKPFLVTIGLFELHKWANYFHLFGGYMIITLLSLWITKLFLLLEENNRKKELQ